jgi:pSer/pThr/pTyr-binding forkhead associated (FHA) protein
MRINEEDYYGYELNEGDIIKIGRYKIKVRKINLNMENIINANNDNSLNIKKDNNNDISYNDDIKSKESSNKILFKSNNKSNNNKLKDDPDKQCRICFSNDETVSPLISPCSCIGSSKYIHLLCLQQWLQSKIKLDYKEVNDNLISAYRYEKVQCEICKEYMPDFIKKNNNLYEICDYHSNSEGINQNYFTLETIGSLKNHEKYIYHIIVKSEKPISTINIGRAEQCDVRLIDNTISRLHSIITICNNKIYIKDLYSKFGTGILLQNKNFQLCDENIISFQLGRSLITFCQSLKNKKFCKCFKCSKNEKNENNNEEKNEEFYINQNKKYINYESGYDIKEND